jgi:hypothetical protein
MTDDQDLMTRAQRDAIERAYELLGEHFESVLLVVNYELDGEAAEEAHEGYWSGGSMTALGLAEFARNKILNSGKNANKEP